MRLYISFPLVYEYYLNRINFLCIAVNHSKSLFVRFNLLSIYSEYMYYSYVSLFFNYCILSFISCIFVSNLLACHSSLLSYNIFHLQSSYQSIYLSFTHIPFHLCFLITPLAFRNRIFTNIFIHHYLHMSLYIYIFFFFNLCTWILLHRDGFTNCFSRDSLLIGGY